MLEVNMKIVLATHNKNKIKEIENVLSDMLGGVKILTASEIGITEDIQENGTSFEENALIKARAVWKEGIFAIADDSGLCVNALGGRPGIFSARYAGEPCDNEKNNDKLLSELDGKDDRTASFICAIACKLPNGKEFTVRGTANGVILKEKEGTGGFGYDPLFYYPPLGKTFAELTTEEKYKVSHRGNALRTLKEKLSYFLT